MPPKLLLYWVNQIQNFDFPKILTLHYLCVSNNYIWWPIKALNCKFNYRNFLQINRFFFLNPRKYS